MNNLKEIEIEDSSINYYKSTLYSLVAMVFFINGFFPIFYALILPLIMVGKIDIVFLIGFILFVDLIFLPLIFAYLKSIKPFYKVRILISNNEINMYLQNKLYLQYIWSNIEKIELMKFKHNEYKVNFLGREESGSIRLSFLIFKKKKRSKFLYSLRSYAKDLNINFSELQIKKVDDLDEKWIEYNKIKKFI